MAIILLPPSEGKTPAQAGSKLNLKKLSFPELISQRQKVLEQLVALSQGSPAKAIKTLGISAKQTAELELNKSLMSAHCAPAWQIYTGVLFGALDAESLSPSQLKKLSDSTYVQSALFGLVGFTDSIPAYRLSGDCVLPKVGSLVKHWAAASTLALSEFDGLIIDLRSGTYVKLGPIPQSVDAVIPKVYQKMAKGEPKVVSHHNKATKGRIVRAIAQSRSQVRTVDDVANVIAALGADVEAKARPGQPTELKVVVDVL